MASKLNMELLDELRQQDYPLQVTEETANALVCYINAIMQEVPAEYQAFIRFHYDLATSALVHPTGTPDRTNERIQSD